MWSIPAIAYLASLTGCLVSDPPEYEPPEQTVPVLDAMTAQPPPTQFHSWSSGDSVSFSVQFRSEDRGERVDAVLFANYGLDDQAFLGGQELSPGTFDELRTISIDLWVPDGLYGCTQLSLVVTHESNFEPFTRRINRDEDVAIITWWADFNDSGDSLRDCPRGTDPGEG
jgi:hypothetical protein